MIVDFKHDPKFAKVAGCYAYDLVDLDTGKPVPESYLYADDDAGVYRYYEQRPGQQRVFLRDPATKRPVIVERRARLKFVPRPDARRYLEIAERMLAIRARRMRGAYI